jgi:outer membrane protein assembly factor BamB
VQNKKGERKKTQISTKKATFLIGLFLMLTIAVTLVALPHVNAQQTITKKSYAYIGALPNPVGVGQSVLLHVGITESLATTTDGFEGLTVTIERPDNETDTLGPLRTDATGGTGTNYSPSVVGTHYVQTHFPAQWYNYTAFDFASMSMVTRNVWYEASTSEKLELVVQEEPVPYYPEMPLPSEYWTRPIDAQLREWSNISGSWLTTPINFFTPYNEGPESAHILWAKQLTIGGLVGGEEWGHSFEIGDAYEGKWTGSSGPYSWLSSAIIVAGRLYYQETTRDNPVMYHCVDLHTGEELWTKTFLNNQTIDFGQLFYWDSYNMHGTFPYLWVTTGGGGFFGPPAPEVWYAFDAFTGDWEYTMENIPSGTNLYGPDGEIYRYTVNLQQGTVSLWNSTKVVIAGLTGSSAGSWGNNAHGETFDASRGIEWTKPIPTGLTGSVLATFLEDRIIGGTANSTHVHLWGISLEQGKEGTSLFSKTWNAPAYWAEGDLTVSGFGGGWVAWSQEDKVGVLLLKETREYYGFSLENGDNLWGPSTPEHYLNALEDTVVESRAIAYGRLYSASVSGIVYCYNVTTGDLLWSYEAFDPYQEILWANNWWQKPLFITDGKIYTGHYEHSPIDPRPRGAPFLCLNATTGDVIWRADGLFRQTRWGGRAIIGDSIMATMDTYDQRVYAVGKGPSATEVLIQNDVITDGSYALVKGTVMDVSPGTEDYSLRARFPNGVPAIRDENMSDWMLYVYKQFPIPADVEGVEVKLETLDPNGNFYEIGRTTSDASGMYSYAFVPEVPGLYTIIATFEGSGSYYGSQAKTALYVEEAPAASPTPTPPPPSVADVYLMPATVGIIIAIAVATLIIVLVLRKR